MKKRYLLLLLAIISMPPLASAENLKQSSGWELELNFSAAYSYEESQFNTDNDNQITQNLNNYGRTISDLDPFILYKLAYTFEDLNTQIYLGNAQSNIIKGSLLDEIGVTYQFDDETLVTIAYAYNDKENGKTWQDPFKTATKRLNTEQEYQGLRLRADYISGLPISLEFGVGKSEIDDEQSGQTLNLSQSQLQLLKRENDTKWAILEGFLPISNDILIRPSLSFAKSNAEGDSNSFNGLATGVTVLAGTDQQYFTATVNYAVNDYQAVHPIFNKTREDKSLSVFVTYGYEKPFGWNNTTFTIMTGWGTSDSNINFYDSTGGFAASGFSYRFF